MFFYKTNVLQNNYEMYVSKISTTLNNILDHLNAKRDLYAVGPLSEAVSQHFSKIQLKVLQYCIMITNDTLPMNYSLFLILFFCF